MSEVLKLSETRVLQEGDIVQVRGLPGRFVVLDTSDPALLAVKSESGATFRVGRMNVERVEGAQHDE